MNNVTCKMKGCCNNSRQEGLVRGSFFRQLFKKSLNSEDHMVGSRKLGGSPWTILYLFLEREKGLGKEVGEEKQECT